MCACRSLQDLPVDILLEIADHLDSQGLVALLHTLPHLTPFLGTAHMAAQDADSKTVLHLLAEEPDTRIDLFEAAVHKTQGRHINTQDRFGRTPLSTAICFYKLSMIEILLKQPNIDVNLPGMHGLPPLQNAAIVGSTYMLSMLLDHDDTDTDTGVPVVQGGHLLAEAARHVRKKGKKELEIKWLDSIVTETRARIDDRRRFEMTLFAKAAEAGDATLVSMLLAMLDDVQANRTRRKPNLITPLINVNTRTLSGSTPLAYALFHSHKAVSQQLIPRPDVDVNLKGFYRPPLTIAIEQGDLDAAKLLLARGADIDADAGDLNDRTPLSHAAQRGYTEIVQLLLDRDDVDPNRVDSRRLSPLLVAIEADQSDVVMLLLRHGRTLCCSFDLILHTPTLYCAVLDHPDWIALWPRCECLGCSYYHLNDPAYMRLPEWKQYVCDYYMK